MTRADTLSKAEKVPKEVEVRAEWRVPSFLFEIRKHESSPEANHVGLSRVMSTLCIRLECVHHGRLS